jgi:acyl dehydratase
MTTTEVHMSVEPQYPPVRKETIYDQFEIPEDLGPFTVVVDDAAVKEFAFTQDDYHPWHLGEGLRGQRIAHASLLANDLLQTYLTKYQTNLHDSGDDGGSWIDEAHIFERLTFHSPVAVGETVTIEGRYVDKHVRRGRGRVVMEAEARGADGRLLMTHHGVEIVRLPPGEYEERPSDEQRRPVSGGVRSDVAPASRASADLEPGTGIETIVKRPTRSQIAVYSTIYYLGTRPNIHTDLEIAKRAKLDELVLQGQQGACWIAELLTRFFGESWLHTGELEVKFIKPILAGDEVTVGGTVSGTRERDGQTHLDVDVWLRRADGELATVGWASAAIGG